MRVARQVAGKDSSGESEGEDTSNKRKNGKKKKNKSSNVVKDVGHSAKPTGVRIQEPLTNQFTVADILSAQLIR